MIIEISTEVIPKESTDDMKNCVRQALTSLSPELVCNEGVFSQAQLIDEINVGVAQYSVNPVKLVLCSIFDFWTK